MTRGARHLALVSRRWALLALRGETRVSPDGSEVELEQVQERADIVLIGRPGR